MHQSGCLSTPISHTENCSLILPNLQICSLNRFYTRRPRRYSIHLFANPFRSVYQFSDFGIPRSRLPVRPSAMQSTGQRTRCIYQRSVSANDLIAECSSHYYFTPSHDDIRGSHFALCDFVSRWQTSSKSLQRFLYVFSFASALDHLILPATLALYLIPFSQVRSCLRFSVSYSDSCPSFHIPVHFLSFVPYSSSFQSGRQLTVQL